MKTLFSHTLSIAIGKHRSAAVHSCARWQTGHGILFVKVWAQVSGGGYSYNKFPPNGHNYDDWEEELLVHCTKGDFEAVQAATSFVIEAEVRIEKLIKDQKAEYDAEQERQKRAAEAEREAKRVADKRAREERAEAAAAAAKKDKSQ